MPQGDQRRGTAAGLVGQRRDRPTGDRGNAVAIEAVLAMVVVAAAVAYVAANSGGVDPHQGASSSELRGLVADALAVLDLGDEETTLRTTPLTQLVGDAVHGRSGPLGHRIERLLPRAAQVTVHLDNGYGSRTLVENGAPGGPAVTESVAITPRWAGVVVVPDLRVYPNGTDANMTVTAVPHLASRSPDPLAGVDAVYENGFRAPLEESAGPSGAVENTSIPNASGSGDGYTVHDLASAEVRDVVGDHVLEGVAVYRTRTADVVADAHGPARDGLAEATVSVTPDPLQVGETVTVQWNMTPVADAVDPHLNASAPGPEASLALYPPAPRPDPDAAVEGSRVQRGLLQEGNTTHEIPRGGVVGRWTAVVQLNYTLDAADGDVNQSARLVDTFLVRPPDGGNPRAATYDLEVVAWYPDR